MSKICHIWCIYMFAPNCEKGHLSTTLSCLFGYPLLQLFIKQPTYILVCNVHTKFLTELLKNTYRSSSQLVNIL